MMRVLTASAILAASGAAFAGPNFSVEWQQIDNSVGGSGLPTTNDPSWTAGNQTWRLFLNFEPGTVINGINLGIPGQNPSNPTADPNFLYISGGTVYNNAAGGDVAPNAAFLPFPGFEGLAYDSYVGLEVANPASQVGFAANMNWGTDASAPNRIRGTWFVSPGASADQNGDGRIMLMQITISSGTLLGGNGSSLVVGWTDFSRGSAGQPAETQLDIPEIPAPGALALFGLAGAAATRRRR